MLIKDKWNLGILFDFWKCFWFELNNSVNVFKYLKKYFWYIYKLCFIVYWDESLSEFFGLNLCVCLFINVLYFWIFF